MVSSTLNPLLLNGTNGFTINGIAAYDYSGYSVSSAGDINGDGVDDLIIGAYGADPNGKNSAGQSYVVFGSKIGFAASLNLSALNGTNGFTINGIAAGDLSGYSVGSAGDVNGDGIDDLIIGAYGADPNGKNAVGQSYVVFGRGTEFPASLNLSTLDGISGFTINGIAANDFSGYAVSCAGDVNGDGLDDLIIGAYNANNGIGQSYVVFGSKTNLPATLDLSTLNGRNGFIINGIATGDGSGISVSTAGDINGDGIDDLIIGASGADPNKQNAAGQSYVVFGQRDGLPATLDLSTLNGRNGFIINGMTANDKSGISVRAAGDVNGDGIDDLIIGASGIDSSGGETNGNNGAGQSYVVFGTKGELPAKLDLSKLDGTNGFTISGLKANGRLGISVSGAGDINGDGISDLIIGAYSASPKGNSYAGQSYIVFGTKEELPAKFDLSTLDGTNGFIINGIAANDRLGTSVSGAGDINGDGINDLIIGAYGANANGNKAAGQSYVIFGGTTLITEFNLTSSKLISSSILS